MNKVILIGNLGADPKTLTTKNGKPYTTLRIATSRSWKNADGDEATKTDWHAVTVFGKQAENCILFLRKGAPVCVQGCISNFATEVEGRKTWRSVITAEDVIFLPSPRPGGSRRQTLSSETIGLDQAEH